MLFFTLCFVINLPDQENLEISKCWVAKKKKKKKADWNQCDC